MYLAPLNYDRYFKKVFKDTLIAKRFLEDFFDITIEEIELLTQKHKITDDAVAVEFDFRCKINGNYVIIDMQQWFKPDIVNRFYVYHCINTALQLEEMPVKSIFINEDVTKEIKDYSLLQPVVTLIWMVEDTLGYTDDYVGYNMTPEMVSDFITNDKLWLEKDIQKLIAEREIALKQLNNNTKNLSFLKKNRLIWAFQKNIVKNKKFSKYKPWFELAEKTRNKLNEKADFLQFEQDKIFAEIIRRICKDALTVEDINYIENRDNFWDGVSRYEIGLRKELMVEVIMQVKEEVREEIKEEVREEVREEVKEEVKEEVREEVKEEVLNELKIEIVKSAIDGGLSNELIQQLTKLPLNEIERIRKEQKK